MLSAVDGHRTAGIFAFSIGVSAPQGDQGAAAAAKLDSDFSAPPRWLSVLTRWFNFGAMAAFIGAATFPLLVLTAAGKTTVSQRRALITVRRSIFAAIALLLVSTLLFLWTHVWSAAGSAFSASALEDVMTGSRFGDVWLVRMLLVVFALVYAIELFRRRERELPEGNPFSEPSVRWLPLAVLAIAVPATTSFNSHAAAGDNEALRILVDWAHIVAGGFWIGGLLQLLVLVPSAEDGDARPAFFASVIPRFSLLAVISVIAIVSTGILQSWQRLNGPGDLVDSNYGYTLLAKVTLLMPLLGLGAFNLLIVRPRFTSLAQERIGDFLARSVRWEGRFVRGVAAEVTLAVLILAAAAVLTDTSPPAGAPGVVADAPPASTSQVSRIKADDLDVTLVVEPGKIGPNDISVFLEDEDGNEAEIQRVVLRFTYKDEQLGETEDDAEPLHPPDHFVLSTSQLSLAGVWDIEVIVRRTGLLDARATFTVNVQV
jgi:copper transport protein